MKSGRAVTAFGTWPRCERMALARPAVRCAVPTGNAGWIEGQPTEASMPSSDITHRPVDDDGDDS